MADAARPAVLDLDGLQALVDELRARGYRVVGPTVRDGAIVYDEIASVEDLPAGWTDEQDAGRYRLRRRDDGALFGHAVGPHSWKRFLFPPRSRLWRAEQGRDGIEAPEELPEPPPPYAFLGVRACELAAIAVQDRVFLGGRYRDPIYEACRAGAFVVAVNCGAPGGTCFCASMGTGPQVTAGFDLALTELLGDGGHEFVTEVGGGRGAEVLAALPSRPATAADLAAAASVTRLAADRMGRTIDTTGVRDLLVGNPEHPRWEEVADRCLACGNCTMVCPTCFCWTVEDTADLDGAGAERWRRWDSCFTLDFSLLGGRSVRASTRARYRQWLTHKLANWIDQFGTSGCVGCGRCITWCPVGIDLTEEVRAIRQDPTRSDEGSPP
jgi:sulfhydrogenase subunit beta (sulfur reductase)